MAGLQLLSAGSNGTGASKQTVDHSKGNIGKRFSYSLFIYGTVDSADIQLQASHDDATFVDIAGAAFTNTEWPTATNLEFYGNFIRVKVANGLGSESVNVVLV